MRRVLLKSYSPCWGRFTDEEPHFDLGICPGVRSIPELIADVVL